MSTANYRARSATELVDGAIQLLRGNYPTFLTLGAVFYVPVLVFQWNMLSALRTPGDMNQIGAAYGRFAVMWPFLILWTAAWYTVIFTVASDVYLGGPADIGSALNRGMTRFLPTFGASIIKALSVGIAYIFFFVPGIILALYWFATPAAAVLEKVGVFASFGRSGTLSRGLKWHVFKTYLVTLCIFAAAYVLFVLIGAVIAFLARAVSAASPGMVTTLIISVGMMFIYPLWPIVATLLYYDARIRNEGFDIELMAKNVPAAGAPATA